MDIAELRKIYANKSYRKQEVKRANMVRNKVDSQNWTYAGGRSNSIPKPPRSPLAKSNTTRLGFDKQFAKSYGHGGFYRANIQCGVESVDNTASRKGEAESQYMNRTMVRFNSQPNLAMTQTPSVNDKQQLNLMKQKSVMSPSGGSKLDDLTTPMCAAEVDSQLGTIENASD